MDGLLFTLLLREVLNKLFKFLLNIDPTLIFKPKFSFSFSFFIYFFVATVELCWFVMGGGWWDWGLEWFGVVWSGFLFWNFLFLIFLFCVRMGKQCLMLQKIRTLLNWSSNWRFYFFISLSSFFFFWFYFWVEVE